jgi:hypothetical protein
VRVRLDHAGEEMAPAGVDLVAATARGVGSKEGGDVSTGDTDRGRHDPAERIDNVPVADEEIKLHAHSFLPLAGPVAPLTV